jgi:pyruvate formate lyase activating enzyme
MGNGIPVILAQAADELTKYRQGWTVMSGGFTLSGGELLMQYRFAVKLLSAAHAIGIHTALYTNGYLGDRLTDADRHRHLTGMEVGPVLDFARRLAAGRKPVWVRFVLASGLTDHPEEIDQIARFAAGLGNVASVDVLPFHQMGRYKWKELGLNCTLDHSEPPSTEAVERGCARAAGLTAY